MASRIRGTVDFAIITIKEEEFAAVLKRFPPTAFESGLWEYNICDVPYDTFDGSDTYRVATVRCLKQATNEAQSVTGYIIEDLDPRWILLVGIAGAIPAAEYTLGDVVVSTRVYDLNVGAVVPGSAHHYAITSDSIHEDVAPFVANLHANARAFQGWNTEESLGLPRPTVDVSELEEKINGDEEWRGKIRGSILRHFGTETTPRPPLYTAGPIASSDDLIKDPSILQRWQTHARDIYAVEMESAGVHRGARRRGHSYPFVSIRGLSDVVGLARDHAWTMYACETAAAFTQVFAHMIAGRLRDSDPKNRRLQRNRPTGLDNLSNLALPDAVRTKPARRLPLEAAISDPLVVAYNVVGRDVLEEYCHRTSLQPDEAALAILRRLNWAWSEPLPAAELDLLAESPLTPGVNYPSPTWVLEQLPETPPLVQRVARAIRSTARWPESYRLNYVRQLSTTNLTRALGAGHTRLAHCLGTLDVTACLVGALSKNSPGSVDLEMPVVREWVVSVLLFAFLHDRYHGPLGHSLDPMSWLLNRAPAKSTPESALRKLDKEVLESELRTAQHKRNHPLRRLVDFVVRTSAGDDELLTQPILQKLHALVRLGHGRSVPPQWQFFQDMVDGELDADRLDYLWRDALHLSVPSWGIGEIEETLRLPEASPIGALVASARVAHHDGKNRIAFAPAHSLTVDALLSLRFLFYLAFYENPEKRIYDELMTRTIRKVLEESGCLEEGRVRSPELSTELRTLTDQDLFHFLQECAALVDPDGRPVMMTAAARMTHDVVQARPWRIVWTVALSEADFEREAVACTAHAALVEAIAAQDVEEGDVESAKRALREVAKAGFAGTLPALYVEHGLEAPQGARYSLVSAVVDFYLDYRGSFEALRTAEASLWARLCADPEVARALDGYHIESCWDDDVQMPRLLVMGMIKATPPAIDRVLVSDDRGGAERMGAESRWSRLLSREPTFVAFAAVHPRLLGLEGRAREHVEQWFAELGFLDL